MHKTAIPAGGPVTLLASSQQGPNEVAVDALGGHVYWTNRGEWWNSNGIQGSVQRVSINGGAVEVLASGQIGAYGIVLDATHLYWTNSSGTGGSIQRAPLAGGPAEVLASGLNWPYTLVVHGTNVYWTNAGTDANGFLDGTVMSVPTTGGTATIIASSQSQPTGIVADANNLYWANRIDGTIWRAGL